MKTLILTIAMLFTSLAIFSQSGNMNSNRVEKVPFAISSRNLTRHLDLSYSQTAKVEQINIRFIEMQKTCIGLTPELQEKQLSEVISTNLKSLKSVLNPYQYRRYLILLNMTNNNRKATNKESDLGYNL